MTEPLAKFSSLSLGSLADCVPMFGEGDALGMRGFLAGVYRNPDSLRQGMVIAYHPQTHSASVQVFGDQSIWSCVFADEMLSYAFGFSETHPAREGELVLVFEVAPGAQAGVVVGRIPYPLCFRKDGDLYNDPDNYHRRLFTQLDKTKDQSIPCYSTPFSEKNDDATHIATHFRPTDIYPGEFAKVNQHNCGIKGGLFSATLLGGGASLRLSALTNAARLACDAYLRHSMSGSVHEFHNGRYLSSERTVALYQEERLGGIKPQDEVWANDPKSESSTNDAEMPKGGENQTIRPRLKDLSGFFGHLSSKFCLRPDPSESEVRVQGGSEPTEAGVSRETIDPSGQYRLSAAGMIVLERTGRIPVPVRKCYPTDKDHDIPSNPEALTAFQHSEEDPCYRQLELFDRQAYDLKTQYARVDGLGVSEPDYTVPQEEDLKPLDDKYDEKFTGSETVKLKKFDKRRAGFYIGEDGSVIVRDAWGSEIVMLGGNVTISCAQSLMLLPGKTQLTIAGDDIVQKAQNSVDIHASEHDVRLSAARNMEIVGGGDDSQYAGGVIIESHGKAPSPWDGKDLGENARLCGITLRTHTSGVVIDGKDVVMRSRRRTRLLSGEKGSLDGEIGIGADNIRVRAGKTLMASAGAAGGNVLLQNNSAFVTAKNVTVAGESGLTMLKGAKYPIPLKWVDAQNVAAEVDPQIDESTQDLKDEKDASIGFDAEALEKMVFGFRTSDECNTTQPWAVSGSGSAWRMYEPAWIQVKSIYETLKNGGVDTKAYEDNPSWENGRPFPGKEAEDSGEYAQLAGLAPRNLTGEGFNVSREAVQDQSQFETPKFKGGYLIRK